MKKLDSQVDINEADIQWDPEAGPGRRLRNTREALGLSTKEVSKRLRIDIKHIEAIERDDYETVAPVFVRGYLRSYAHLLNLPADTIVDRYEYQGVSTASKFKPPIVLQGLGGDRVLHWLSYPIVLGLITLLVIGWQTQGMSSFWDSEPAASSQASDSRESTEAAPKAPPSERSQVVIQTSSPPPQPRALPMNEVALPGAEIEAARRPALALLNPAQLTANAPAIGALETPANSNFATVVLNFTSDSWVEIIDAEGKRLVYSLMKEGTNTTLEAVTPPLRVLLGNAPGVSIQYNGSPFDHSRYNQNGLARFVLGEPGDEAG